MCCIYIYPCIFVSLEILVQTSQNNERVIAPMLVLCLLTYILNVLNQQLNQLHT